MSAPNTPAMTPSAPTGEARPGRVIVPTQLRLPPPPGYCQCGCRLSVASVGGLCDECDFHQHREFKPAPVSGLCRRCHVAPARPHETTCAPCQSALNREYYLRRQKQYATEKRAQRQPAASPDGARVGGGGRR